MSILADASSISHYARHLVCNNVPMCVPVSNVGVLHARASGDVPLPDSGHFSPLPSSLLSFFFSFLASSSVLPRWCPLFFLFHFVPSPPPQFSLARSFASPAFQKLLLFFPPPPQSFRIDVSFRRFSSLLLFTVLLWSKSLASDNVSTVLTCDGHSSKDTSARSGVTASRCYNVG
jgi:hypothetical protein